MASGRQLTERVASTDMDADCTIDGMLAYRVDLAGQNTVVPDDIVSRAMLASIDHAQQVCLFGKLGDDAYVWRGLRPVLNTSFASRISSSDYKVAHARSERQGESQGRDDQSEEATPPTGTRWRKST